MRNDFVKQAIEEMKANPHIVFLTGDLGFNALEPIQTLFPDRFYNVGIAEANMVGMACGLAHEGKKVICYSIASFILRAYEQIRLDVCYDNLDIKLIGTGGGFNYAMHGVTHHTIEDLAAISALPNIAVANPAYSFEAQEVTKALLRTNMPCYARFGKNPKCSFQKLSSLPLGRAHQIRAGAEIVILSTGNLIDRSLAVAERVEQKTGKSVGVLSVPWIKPLDRERIGAAIQSALAVFTIEEHSVIGGLGSVVAQFLMEQESFKKQFQSFGVQDRYHKEVGSRDYLLDCAGLGVESLARQIEEKIESRSLVRN